MVSGERTMDEGRGTHPSSATADYGRQAKDEGGQTIDDGRKTKNGYQENRVSGRRGAG